MLHFLVFERQEATDGVVVFEAMAAVPEARWPALQAELAQVLAWCHAWGKHHGAPHPQPLDDGGEWDAELRVSSERIEALVVAFDPRLQTLACTPEGDGFTRYSATLSVSGHGPFAADFLTRFPDD